MDEIMQLAARLGGLIRNHPKGQAMIDAGADLEKSSVDRQLLADYEAAQHKLRGLEESGKPIEPDDKRRYADLHAKVVSSLVIKKLLKAQADYMELMTVVSQTIEDAAMGEDDGAPGER